MEKPSEMFLPQHRRILSCEVPKVRVQSEHLEQKVIEESLPTETADAGTETHREDVQPSPEKCMSPTRDPPKRKDSKEVPCIQVSRAAVKAFGLTARERAESCAADETGQGKLSRVAGYYKEGYLKKQGKGMFSKWKLRYCLAKDLSFVAYYYHPRGVASGRQKISIALDFSRTPVTLSAVDSSKPSFTLSISLSPTETKDFTFSPRSGAELLEWTNALTLQLRVAATLPEKYVPSLPKFWRYVCTKYATISKDADTGDVILFRGKRAACKLQRFVTGSRFGIAHSKHQEDHVGVLVRCWDNRLAIVDATAEVGVGIETMDTFIKKKEYEAFELVVYRKLEHKRSGEELAQLKAHIQVLALEQTQEKLLGKKYDVSLWRLMQKYSVKDSVTVIPENKSYFCSELVAALYKFMGLLPTEISSANF